MWWLVGGGGLKGILHRVVLNTESESLIVGYIGENVLILLLLTQVLGDDGMCFIVDLIILVVLSVLNAFVTFIALVDHL